MKLIGILKHVGSNRFRIPRRRPQQIQRLTVFVIAGDAALGPPLRPERLQPIDDPLSTHQKHAEDVWQRIRTKYCEQLADAQTQ